MTRALRLRMLRSCHRWCRSFGGGHMNPNAVGTYIITYDYMDTKDAAATTITQQVEVFDNKPL